MAQETEAAAGQRRGQQASSRLMQAETHRQQTHCSDTAHARRQTIKTIEPVDGVGDTHQPDHRCQQAEPIWQWQQQIRASPPAHGDLDVADAHTLVPRNHRNGQLAGQAGQGRQGIKIICQPDQEKAKGASQGGPDQLVLFSGKVGEPPQGPDESQGCTEGDNNADSTKAHHR